MKDAAVFVSGANRGIGLEFARQLTAAGAQCIAGYRSEDRSKELFGESEKHDNLHAVKVDVTNTSDLKSLAEFIQSKFGRLDLLINNAGVNFGQADHMNDVDIDGLRTTLEVNVTGVHLMTMHLYDLLTKGNSPKIVNIGSRLGLIGHGWNHAMPYRLSKAALNMLTSMQAEQYKDDKITAVVFSPGWVRTDMGGPNANLSTEESVSSMLKVFPRLSLDDTGQFFSHDGQRIPMS